MSSYFNVTDVGTIGNYYGGLGVMDNGNGEYFWSIENWDGHNWKPIPKYLYNTLIRYEKARKKAKV